MIHSAARVDSDILECEIPVNNRVYMKCRTALLVLVLSLLCMSCSVSKRGSAPDVPVQAELSVEEQRRYEYFFLEAIRLEQLGRYDEAMEMLNHCQTISPTAPSAQYKLATYYFTLNQKEKALEALLKAVEYEPDNYWYQQTLASYYQGNREYEKAIAVLEDMQDKFPKRNAELLSALIGLYSQAEQYDKVVDALDRLEVLIGKTEAISMEKSRNFLLMGNKEEAIKEMEALAEEYPDNTYYRVILAEVHMNHNQLAEAEQLLHDVLGEEPDNGPAKIALAQCYEAQGDTVRYRAMVDSALMSATIDDDTKSRLMVQLIRSKADSTYVMQTFEKAIMQQPQRTAKLGHLCVQYMLAHQQPEERVRPILQRMLEVEPDHVQARLQLLSYAARRNDVEEIVSLCSAAISYTPEILDFYYYKAIGLYQKGDKEEALETYRKATRQITKDSNTELSSDIFAAMGDLYNELEQPAQAYLCYDSALVYNPSNVLVLNNYAYYLSEEDASLEKAEQMSLRAIKAEPDNATYLDTYAWVLYKLGRYGEALEYIEKALAADSLPSDVLYEHAGDICHALGDNAKALQYWKQALELQQRANAIDDRLRKKIKNIKK